MTKTSSQLLKISLVLFTSTVSCLLAHADNTTRSEVEKNLEKLEDTNDSDNGITIRPKNSERKITEKRENGRVTEIKVNNGNGAPAYYLKPNTPAGSALPGDVQSNSIRAPQWEVLEFGGPRNQNTDEQNNNAINADSFPPAPPPPAMQLPTPIPGPSGKNNRAQ